MASVLKVYEALKDISNKEQKGFITPAVFNSFAHIAQMNVYNELFDDFTKAQGLIRQGLDAGRDKSVRKFTSEDVSMYVRDVQLTKKTGTSNRFYKPENLGKIISLRVNALARKFDTNRTPCEIVYDVEKMNMILGSNLSTPTQEFPVALISDDVELFPDTIRSATLTYYCTPRAYKYGTRGEIQSKQPQINFIPGTTAVDIENSYDFMIPDEYVPEIIAEMCELLGVRLRDQNLQGYGARKESAE
jgi:hypothetical protein